MSKNNTTKTARKSRAITAALLLFVILSLTFITTGCKKKFDYLKADLNKYIEFSGDYKNFKLEIDIAEPREIDVDIAILNMLYADRDENPRYNGGLVTSPITITSGDVVDIWYRGYLISDDGEKIAVSGMTNFAESKPTSLAIGANQFVPGFEYNLIGKNTGDYSKFNKLTTGDLTTEYIAYVSYSKTKNGESSKVSANYERIELSTDLDATYGAGFKEKLLATKIGGDKIEFETTLGDATYKYTDFKVNYATDCEKNPMVIECYFPYDYSNAELRNETAYFEVYVDGVVVYDCPEFNDEYLKKKIEDKEINLTLDELNKYEGEKLIDKYRDYAEKRIYELYEETYNSKVEEAAWNYINNLSKAKDYPYEKIDEIFEDYVDDISAQFVTDGGKIYNNNTGMSNTYDTFDAYATAYLGITSSTTYWQDELYYQCAGIVEERLTMFYILKAENLLPSDAEYKAEYDQVIQEFVDDAIDQYLYYAGKTKDELTDEEYSEMVEDCRETVMERFDDSYFSIRVYYRILADNFVKWPKVSTLNDRRAYPQGK